MLYAFALLLMIVAVLFLCLSVNIWGHRVGTDWYRLTSFFRFIVARQQDAQRRMTAAKPCAAIELGDGTRETRRGPVCAVDEHPPSGPTGA